MTEPDRLKTALGFMQLAARQAFELCATTAEDTAAAIERGNLPNDAVVVLRLMATLFRTSAERP